MQSTLWLLCQLVVTSDDENTPQLNFDQLEISDLWNIYERIEAAA